MEIATLGKVIVSAKIENLSDVFAAEQGIRMPEDVRTVDVDDALVDTGATLLSLPKSMIGQLGLTRIRTRTARTAGGTFQFGIYNPVRLTVQGRDCRIDVAEVPDNCPVLIGQLPLEMLDWVVDPIHQRLIGNPEHGGEQMIELYSLFE